MAALNGQCPFNIQNNKIPNDQRSDSKGLCGVFETTSGAIYVGVPQYEFIVFDA